MPAAQVCPCFPLHAPLASHVPVHRPFGSSMPFAVTQVWLAESHIAQLPGQSLFVQQPVEGMHIVVAPDVQAFVEPEQV